MSQKPIVESHILAKQLSKLPDGELIFVPSIPSRVNYHFGRIQSSHRMEINESGLVSVPVYQLWVFSPEYEREGWGGLELYGPNQSITISPSEQYFTGVEALKQVEALPGTKAVMNTIMHKYNPFPQYY